MTKLPLSRWIPEGAEPIVRDGVAAVCYLWNSPRGCPSVLMYQGNRRRSDFHYSYKTEQDARDGAARFLDTVAANTAAKAERRAAQKAVESKPNPLTVGSILVCSWGYEQTNIDYYEVTAKVGQHFVEIRAIAQQSAGSNGGPSELVAPAPGTYKGEPMRKRARHDGTIRIASYANAYVWDGKPKHQTSGGWGH